MNTHSRSLSSVSRFLALCNWVAALAIVPLSTERAWSQAELIDSDSVSPATEVGAVSSFAKPVSDILAGKLDDGLEWLIAYVMLLAIVGAASMAIVELLKALFPVRRVHHGLALRWFFREEFRDRGWLTLFADVLFKHPPAQKASPALRQMIALGAGSADLEPVWCDQSSTDFFNQCLDAADLALELPERYPDLARFLGIPASGQRPADPPPDRRQLRHLAARRIESLRVSADWIWSRANQIVAMGLSSTAILWLAQDLPWDLPPKLITAGLGGLIAPFAKDLMTRLGEARGLRV